MTDKVNILFLTDRNRSEQMEKASLMMKSFIDIRDTSLYRESKDMIIIETDTHYVRIVKLDQSPRGYRAHFIIDLTGFEDCRETSEIKSTYSWTFTKVSLNEQLSNNGWESI